MYDTIIVGGSYAGLAAALQLGRTRRRVLVLDAGQRRNRFAAASHGFLGQDGQTPEAIAAKGRAEVLAYPSVTWQEASVTETRAIDGGFSVRAGAEQYHGKRLILATGVADELPPIPGLSERWGRSVFHCPYCHGYELDKGRLGVLATGPLSIHHAVLVTEWAAENQTIFFLDGKYEPTAEELAELASRGVVVEREGVVQVSGEAPGIEIGLRDGRTIELDGLFAVPRTLLRTPFAEQLGCELVSGPTGSYYKTDEMKQTSVAGVFACGDAATAAGALTMAVADGVRAGVAAHRSLVFERRA